MMTFQRIQHNLTLSILLCLVLAGGGFHAASAQALAPSAAAEEIRAALVNIQLGLASDPALALVSLRSVEATFTAALAPELKTAAPQMYAHALAAFADMARTAQAGDTAGFAAARAQAWTAILAGAVQTIEQAVQNDSPETARAWLSVREFRTATRFSRPGADATLALDRFTHGQIPASEAILAIQADLLDTYQARLGETLRAIPSAEENLFPARRAELAALAEGYFAILSPAYVEQRGEAALANAQAAFTALQSGDPEALAAVTILLEGFRAAPLSPAEQVRRAGQLLRFISLIPVEYARGANNGQVRHDFEIQEAMSFYEASRVAFADLQDVFPTEAVPQAARLLDNLGEDLSQASHGGPLTDPVEVQKTADELLVLFEGWMPAAWLEKNTQGDFDTISLLLDQLVTAASNGVYDQAEAARLGAYATLETGPEARLIILAPHLIPEIEDLFWNGQGNQKGLAYLIKNHAPVQEIRGSRSALNALLSEAEQALSRESSPWAVASNAGVIVFREGMEAVVILASLMSSLRRSEERKFRKPMWWGALAAFAATLATWLLARGILESLAHYGEKLEAIVSLVAVAVLLVIMNWFFHKVYWTGWIAQFHSRKRRLLSGEAGLVLGLAALGFTSVYREGFEVVLFLQALVLSTSSSVVLAGTAAGLLLVLLLGVITFRLQVNLPYRKMLIVTGILIGMVLLQIVGKTVYAMQVVGWMPIHSIQQAAFPYWVGAWFGVYTTWEGIVLQTLSAAFVIGSYFAAEWMQQNRRRGVSTHAAEQA